MAAKGGRKSRASQEIATLAKQITDVQIINYPDPDYELTEAEANVWRAVVHDCDPEWFSPKNLGLLKQYCRHSVRADRIAFMIRRYEEDLDRAASGQATIGYLDDIGYDKLLRMQQSESRSIAMLLTKMRLAQQSMVDPETRKNRRSGGAKKLWE